ncbi:hypothetical protein [Mumia zhuanghuii]|uniref:Uncharacterized protein n=1 Tax=Mumia zhuanghuii TaxID=2585211 RepID=A0A5C4MFI8_9ACTN|nr:hypothetical protein [Mumia zhuanghuii]TNC35585.1 hypothetical protein FHE65_26930 [Mumia zhuanghuii]
MHVKPWFLCNDRRQWLAQDWHRWLREASRMLRLRRGDLAKRPQPQWMYAEDELVGRHHFMDWRWPLAPGAWGQLLLQQRAKSVDAALKLVS